MPRVSKISKRPNQTLRKSPTPAETRGKTAVGRSNKPTLAGKSQKTDPNSTADNLKTLLKNKTKLSTNDILSSGLDLSKIEFDKESLELLLNSMEEQSPFIFYKFPFNEIKNWRQLLRANPKFALQNKMLDAIEQVNYFSKNDLNKFKEKYDDLLKTKSFYNYFIENARVKVLERVGSIKESRNLNKITESLNYIEQTFKKYKYAINPIKTNGQTSEDAKRLNKKFDEIQTMINDDFDSLLMQPETLDELISYINIKFNRMLTE